jgi:hypothetical protein
MRGYILAIGITLLGLIGSADAQQIRTTSVNIAVDGRGYPVGGYGGVGFVGRNPRWPGPGAYTAPGRFPGYVRGAPRGAWPGDGRTRNWYETPRRGPGWEYYDRFNAAYDPCYGSSVLNPRCRGYGYGPGGINIQVQRQTIQPAPQQYATQAAPLAVPTEVISPQAGPDQPSTTARENTYEQAAAMALPVDLTGTPDQPTPMVGGGKKGSTKSNGSGSNVVVDMAARKGVAHLNEEMRNVLQRLCDAEEQDGVAPNPKCKKKE